MGHFWRLEAVNQAYKTHRWLCDCSKHASGTCRYHQWITCLHI